MLDRIVFKYEMRVMFLCVVEIEKFNYVFASVMTLCAIFVENRVCPSIYELYESKSGRENWIK